MIIWWNQRNFLLSISASVHLSKKDGRKSCLVFCFFFMFFVLHFLLLSQWIMQIWSIQVHKKNKHDCSETYNSKSSWKLQARRVQTSSLLFRGKKNIWKGMYQSRYDWERKFRRSIKTTWKWSQHLVPPNIFYFPWCKPSCLSPTIHFVSMPFLTKKCDIRMKQKKRKLSKIRRTFFVQKLESWPTLRFWVWRMIPTSNMFRM